LRAGHFDTDRKADLVRSFKDPAPPPPCSINPVFVKVANDVCYNFSDGSISDVLHPGQIYAWGCGPDENAAIEAAKVSLMTQMCLTTKEEHRAGCCTYRKER
jgi:hypothetical protein